MRVTVELQHKRSEATRNTMTIALGELLLDHVVVIQYIMSKNQSEQGDM